MMDCLPFLTSDQCDRDPISDCMSMNMKYGMDGDHVDIAGSHSMADIIIVCLLCIYSSCKSKTLKHGRPNS
jgi:hypothetical protein